VSWRRPVNDLRAPLPRQKGERERGEHEDEQRNRTRLAMGLGPHGVLPPDRYSSQAAGPGRDGRLTTGHGDPPLGPRIRRTRKFASTMSTAVSVSSTKPWNIC